MDLRQGRSLHRGEMFSSSQQRGRAGSQSKSRRKYGAAVDSVYRVAAASPKACQESGCGWDAVRGAEPAACLCIVSGSLHFLPALGTYLASVPCTGPSLGLGRGPELDVTLF